MTTENDRIAGVLLGQAAGDALGSQYEFGQPSGGHAVMGRGTFGHDVGEWTDDTQQAVCVAMGRSQPEAVARNLLAWYRSGPKDVGNQTRNVLSRATDAATMTAAAREYAERSAALSRPGWDPGSGNGSLMRTGPVCLPYLGDHAAVVRAAREVSSLTHATEHDQDACAIWSLAIESAVMLPAGFSASRFHGLLELAVPGSRREFWRDTVYEALAYEPAAFRRNGSAVSAFKCALSAVARSTSLEDGLQLAIDAGNDTDTVAAIAGSLLGAVHGTSAVPEQWRTALHGWPGLDASGLEALALEAAGRTA